MRKRIGFSLFIVAVLLTQRGLAATTTVTSAADSGPGSLREAISNAAPDETIGFSITGTITLTSAELLINKSLIISNQSASSLTIQRSAAGGTPNFRIFNIQAGTNTISGLTVSNGHADVGGGINNDNATLTLNDCILVGNTAAQAG